MNEYDTMLDKMYRCKIEPTGEVLQRIVEFKLPMDPAEKIRYSREREMCIKFPETDLKQFLHDFENWALMLQACSEHPQLQSEYQKLMMLVKILT
jgi:hypothetical protein